jgi:hypothetical protein
MGPSERQWRLCLMANTWKRDPGLRRTAPDRHPLRPTDLPEGDD